MVCIDLLQSEGLVLTLRDLFQVVFEMKKKEVEEAKKNRENSDSQSEVITQTPPPQQQQPQYIPQIGQTQPPPADHTYDVCILIQYITIACVWR